MFDVNVQIRLLVVAGPPAAWQLTLPEDSPLGADGAWSTRCGEPFHVLVEAVDTHGNRCASRTAERAR